AGADHGYDLRYVDRRTDHRTWNRKWNQFVDLCRYRDRSAQRNPTDLRQDDQRSGGYRYSVDDCRYGRDYRGDCLCGTCGAACPNTYGQENGRVSTNPD